MLQYGLSICEWVALQVWGSDSVDCRVVVVVEIVVVYHCALGCGGGEVIWLVARLAASDFSSSEDSRRNICNQCTIIRKLVCMCM